MHPIWAARSGRARRLSRALADRLFGLHLLSRLAEQVVIVMMPPLALIFLVLGTIFVGIATPTEGGAMGATGALVLALAKRRLTWALLRQAMDSTARLSSFVIFILIGASVFTLVFRGVNGDLWVEHLLTSLPGGQLGFLIVVNLMVFVLAFFLDFFELAFIIIPLLAPVADKLGIDLIWFGVLLGVNMQTSFMHPPFGFALFYLRSVAPSRETIDRVTGRLIAPVTTAQIYWGAIPFVVMQLVMVGGADRLPRSRAVLARSRPQGRSDQDPDRGAAEPSDRTAAIRVQVTGAVQRCPRNEPVRPAIVVHSLAHAVAALQAAAEAGRAGPAAQRGRCRAVGRRRLVARGDRGGAQFGAGGDALAALLDCGDDAGAAQSRVARRGRGDRVQRPRRGPSNASPTSPASAAAACIASVRQPRLISATIFSRRPRRCAAAFSRFCGEDAEATCRKTARNDDSS